MVLSKTRRSKSKNRHLDKRSKEEMLVLKEDTNLKEYDPIKNLLDKKKMGAAVMECLIANDTEGALEILENYLYAVDRTQFLKNAKIARSTAYNVFKRRNPTIKTLAKIMHASAHAQ